MINYADISSYLLVSELDIVVFQAASTMALVITDANGSTVVSCSYTPVDGVVKVYDLDRLLSPLIEGVMADFTFNLNSSSTTVHVIQSRTAVSQPAADFIARHFLSPVTSARDTVVGRKEMVTLLSPTDAVDVTATCIYANGGVCMPQSVQLASALAAGQVHEVDCSPSLLVNDALGELVQYTINAGNRLMTYRVSPTQTHRLAMLMRNDFGAWEPCYFVGMNEIAPDITREFVRVGGVLRPLRIDEQENIQSYTGPLRPGTVQLFRSLARSTEIVLLEGGTATDGVAIDGQDIKYTDDDGHLPSMTFTWHRTTRLTRFNVPVIPRLFDDTFDNTFN